MRIAAIVVAASGLIISGCGGVGATGGDGSAVSDMAVAVVGCGKDTDCKGDRICVEGACVGAFPGLDLAPAPDLSGPSPPDMACSEYDNPPPLPASPSLYFNPSDLPDAGRPADYSCRGAFADPAVVDPDLLDDTVQVVDAGGGKVKISLKGQLTDLQNGFSVLNADVLVYLTAADVLADKPIASLKQQQTDAGQVDPKKLGTDSQGNYALSFILPDVRTTRVIVANRDGKGLDSGNKFETIPVYQFQHLWSEGALVATLLSTRQAFPGLVAVTQRDGLSMLVARLSDCASRPVGGAQLTVKGGIVPPNPSRPGCADGKSYDAVRQGEVFYYLAVGGAKLPTRVQKWTSGLGLGVTTNVPVGLATVSASGVVGVGARVDLASQDVVMVADAVTFVDVTPAAR